MEQLKAELMQICRERGDHGSHAQHEATVDNFLQSLGSYLTPKGMKAFTALELREPYVAWVNSHIRGETEEQADQHLISHFWPSSHGRKLKVAQELPPNVVNMFGKKP